MSLNIPIVSRISLFGKWRIPGKEREFFFKSESPERVQRERISQKSLKKSQKKSQQESQQERPKKEKSTSQRSMHRWPQESRERPEAEWNRWMLMVAIFSLSFVLLQVALQTAVLWFLGTTTTLGITESVKSFGKLFGNREGEKANVRKVCLFQIELAVQWMPATNRSLASKRYDS